MTCNSTPEATWTSDRHAPHGWWMLFLVTTSGPPSLAYWVNLG